MNKKLTISLLIGIIFSGIAIYLSFKNIPIKELTDYLFKINYFWTFPVTLIIIFCFFLRALRWQLIISSSKKIGFWDTFHPLMIGFMINCVLPARVGEIARPALLKKKFGVPFTTGLATIATERFFDLFFMILTLSVVLSIVQIDPDLAYTYKNYTLNKETLNIIGNKMLILCIILSIGIFILSVDASRQFIIKIIDQIPSFLSFRKTYFRDNIKKYFSDPVISLINNIASGFTLVKKPLKLFYCMLITFIIWGSQIFSYYIFKYGCPGINLNFFEMSTVFIIICFFIALPSVPGYWGLWEAGGIFGMMLFGISTSEAAGFTLANHALQIIPVVIIGIISAMFMSINIFKISKDNNSS